MRSGVYAAVRHIDDVEDCLFYHVMDLPKIGRVGGQWDLRGRFGDYTGHVDFSEKRALDVGAASGFLTFEMERAGAEVVSFDIDDPAQLIWLPYQDTGWKAEMISKFTKIKNSYWLAYRLMNSQARVCYGNISDIPAELGLFDIVMIGQILVHQSDPVRALCSALARSGNTIVITEGMLQRDEPIAGLCARANAITPGSWWHLSTGLYAELLAMAGFEVVSVVTASYRCITAAQDVPLTTIVARRYR